MPRGVQSDENPTRSRRGDEVPRGHADQFQVSAIFFQPRARRLAEDQLAKAQHPADAGPRGVGQRPEVVAGLCFGGNDRSVLQERGEIESALAHRAKANAEIGMALLVRDLDEHFAQADDLIQRRAQIVQQVGNPLFGIG